MLTNRLKTMKRTFLTLSTLVALVLTLSACSTDSLVGPSDGETVFVGAYGHNTGGADGHNAGGADGHNAGGADGHNIGADGHN